MRPVYNIRLGSSRKLADNTLELTFEVENPPEFTAGQFVSIQFEYQGEQLKRSYSIASTPAQLLQEGTLSIAIGLVPDGSASTCFSKASVGAIFTMTGPFGGLTLPETPIKEWPQRLVLIGTGTGVAPYRAMLPELEQAADAGISIHIIMGTSYRNTAFYLDDFRAFAASKKNVTFEQCLSKEPLDKESSNHEFSGHVQDRFPTLSLSPASDLIYLCGNPAMIDDCLLLLKDAGFGPRQIKREKYTFSR